MLFVSSIIYALFRISQELFYQFLHIQVKIADNFGIQLPLLFKLIPSPIKKYIGSFKSTNITPLYELSFSFLFTSLFPPWVIHMEPVTAP